MYYDIREKLQKLRAINIIIGGRGIGKTYSALSFMLQQPEPFIYLRNTDVQMQESASVFGNPFKRINRDQGRDAVLEAEKRHYLITEEKNILGYGAALSTFSNLRGVDLSDCRWCVFDEFIERRKLSFRQFDAFAGFYETVNRNREIQGEEPFKCILLSNSQTLQNEILAGYGLINKITEMVRNGERTYTTRDLYVELPDVEISSRKKDTANYRLIAGSGAAREALENEFVYDSFTNLGKQPINEYVPLVMVTANNQTYTFYKHKSAGTIYAAARMEWNCKRYDADQYLLFMHEIGLKLTEYYIRGRFRFENYEAKIFVENLLKCG